MNLVLSFTLNTTRESHASKRDHLDLRKERAEFVCSIAPRYPAHHSY
jgi:hypothetical protein